MDFGTSGLPIYDLLLVNSGNYILFHSFKDVAEYWSKVIFKIANL